MTKPKQLAGAIFDLDDTLLDNFGDHSGARLHDYSCVAAAHQVGKTHGIPALQALTLKQRAEAFATAKEHSLKGSMWRILFVTGQVTSEEIEPQHPLLRELMQLKKRTTRGYSAHQRPRGAGCERLRQVPSSKRIKRQAGHRKYRLPPRHRRLS